MHKYLLAGVAALALAYRCSCRDAVAAMLDHSDWVSESAYGVNYYKQKVVVAMEHAGRCCAEPAESDDCPTVLHGKN